MWRLSEDAGLMLKDYKLFLYNQVLPMQIFNDIAVLITIYSCELEGFWAAWIMTEW